MMKWTIVVNKSRQTSALPLKTRWCHRQMLRATLRHDRLHLSNITRCSLASDWSNRRHMTDGGRGLYVHSIGENISNRFIWNTWIRPHDLKSTTLSSITYYQQTFKQRASKDQVDVVTDSAIWIQSAHFTSHPRISLNCDLYSGKKSHSGVFSWVLI